LPVHAHTTNLNAFTNSVILVTPTPGQPNATLEVGPPSGWVAAGLLILLLAFMLYRTLVKTLKNLLRRKK
jgi:hypothetical protein